ncbi:Fructose-bisphosphate aldolase 1 [Nymphaea thermarum]|nr:Fructose-bisphosphate aldolase 1 [Nymphaea thermarum]
MVDVLVCQNIVPGIKVDKVLSQSVNPVIFYHILMMMVMSMTWIWIYHTPLAGSNDESWCQGIDGPSRSAAYYQQGVRFAKCHYLFGLSSSPESNSLIMGLTTIPKQAYCCEHSNEPSALAVKDAAWGLPRYAAISQDNGLVSIAEPEILLDGDHGIDRTFEMAKKVWAEVFLYLAENKSPLVQSAKDKATPEQLLLTP